MYKYVWDEETGGLLLTSEISKFSKEPRPVYYKELDLLGFDKYWNYPKDDSRPLMWAETNNYIYKGRTVARVSGGSLYTAPEIVLLEDPEQNGGLLQFVDIDLMVQKNAEIMESVFQDTIKNVYNAYNEYKNKVDLFYVAFSGGKDSVVTLDIIQRALPHNEFIVLFSDTYMEFPDTYDCVDLVRDWCGKNNIEFCTAQAEKRPEETWKMFGPPATVTRWCCSVHKTAPQIMLLRKLTGKTDFTGMAFVGVRGDESLSRSKYSYITYGGKHKGQYSCNVILDWSSAEIYLYIFQNNLVLNEAYKKGNRRAGCLVCPRAAERNEYVCNQCYPQATQPLINLINECYDDTFVATHDMRQFIGNGGWKARKNGRDLKNPNNYNDWSQDGETLIVVHNPRTDWRIWIKTIGILSSEFSPYEPYTIAFQGKMLKFTLSESENTIKVCVDKQTSMENPMFIKLLKNVFRKAALCVGCRVCQANCPYGYIDFINGQVTIDNRCHHCAQCHKVEKGCLVYKSLEMPKGGIIMAGKTMSLNSYSHHAPKMEWIEQFFKYQNSFDDKNTLGSQMYSFFKRFLRDAKLIDEKGFSETAQLVEKLGIKDESSWGILFVNLCYTPQVNWFVNNTNFDEEYSKEYLSSMMVNDGAKESWTNDIFSSLGRLSELPLGDIGFGKMRKEKNHMVSITRTSWGNPDARVILYSLYKFAEACGDIYQFTLDTLLDDSIEREGVSPTRIFGLDRNTMIRILNGLTVNYPEFISASFTLDLDSITLRPTGSELTSQDVLKLF